MIHVARKLTSNSMRGAAWMLLSTVFFTGIDASIKLAATDIHPFVIAFFRSVFGFMILFPFIAINGVSIVKTSNIKLHVLRGILGASGTLCFFYGISITTLAQATALHFTTPVFGVILAILLLKERVTISKLFALLIGFLGILVIVRPETGFINLGNFLILCSAILQAFTVIVLKKLTKTDSAISITIWMSITISFLAFPFAFIQWQWPDGAGLLLLALIALFGTGGQYCVSRSLAIAEANAVLPIEYVKIIWASIVGFLVFSEVPDRFMIVGIILIIFATSIILFPKIYTRFTSRPTYFDLR